MNVQYILLYYNCYIITIYINIVLIKRDVTVTGRGQHLHDVLLN